MLKAQLHSKIFQLDPAWRSIEDILTGDFFGSFDYLPRQEFFRGFCTTLNGLNSEVEPLDTKGVDWEAVTFDFWPMTFGEEEAAEPDLVIVSNRWLLVVEVKLHSGLGIRQPWREYVVGIELAMSQGLPRNAVRYVVVAPERLDVEGTFTPEEERERQELVGRTYQVRWSDLVAMVDSWLRHGINGNSLLPEHQRLLSDLLAAMRKRRRLAFSGFRFSNLTAVEGRAGNIFAPPRFQGFLRAAQVTAPPIGDFVFYSKFAGFLAKAVPQVHCLRTLEFGKFVGFATSRLRVVVPPGRLFAPSRFRGFCTNFEPCQLAEWLFLKGTNK